MLRNLRPSTRSCEPEQNIIRLRSRHKSMIIYNSMYRFNPIFLHHGAERTPRTYFLPYTSSARQMRVAPTNRYDEIVEIYLILLHKDSC